jgi:hypothetical protein
MGSVVCDKVKKVKSLCLTKYHAMKTYPLFNYAVETYEGVKV